MSLTIVCVPNTILKQTSVKVPFPLSKEDFTFSRLLLDEVQNNKGSAGLAAPQVNVLKRVVVVKYLDKKSTLLINPIITWYSPITEEKNEGCLSIPGQVYAVTRSKVITYEFRDLRGRLHKQKAKGWDARVIQHEVDHLNGVLISDIGTLVEKDEEE
jgi:peptide deformylase